MRMQENAIVAVEHTTVGRLQESPCLALAVAGES